MGSDVVSDAAESSSTVESTLVLAVDVVAAAAVTLGGAGVTAVKLRSAAARALDCWKRPRPSECRRPASSPPARQVGPAFAAAIAVVLTRGGAGEVADAGGAEGVVPTASDDEAGGSAVVAVVCGGDVGAFAAAALRPARVPGSDRRRGAARARSRRRGVGDAVPLLVGLALVAVALVADVALAVDFGPTVAVLDVGGTVGVGVAGFGS